LGCAMSVTHATVKARKNREDKRRFIEDSKMLMDTV
jgi:hypothetical protein